MKLLSSKSFIPLTLKDERRRTPRVDKHFDVHFTQKVGLFRVTRTHCDTTDVSLGGFKMILDSEIKPSTVLSIVLTNPRNNERIHTRAEVVRTRRAFFGSNGSQIFIEHGLEFMSLFPQLTSKKLARWLGSTA